MTDERKPAKPGMSEVSAKFVDAAEAAVEAAASTDEALSALWQEWQRACEANDEAVTGTDNAKTDEAFAAFMAVEDRIENTPTRSAKGAANKLRVAKYWIDIQYPDGTSGEIKMPRKERLSLSVLADLERLAGQGFVVMPAIEDPVLVLKREWEARYKALDEHRDDPDSDDSDEAVQPFYDRLRETEVQILRTQATTPAGIAVKLILWARLHCDADEVSGLSWTRKSIEGHPHDLDRLPVLSALLDLERMSSGTVPPETPPTVTTPAAASSASDPVAQIGRDLATIWRQVWRNEDEQVNHKAHSPERTRLEHLGSHLADRREALEAMAAEIQAGSLEGAMVQIMLVHAEADMMAASTEESNEAQMRTISKLLYSTLAVLERVAGVPREKLGGEAYLTRELDPHALVAGDETKSTA